MKNLFLYSEASRIQNNGKVEVFDDLLNLSIIKICVKSHGLFHLLFFGEVHSGNFTKMSISKKKVRTVIRLIWPVKEEKIVQPTQECCLPL